jgi:phospholipid/cholesterol/gamma-HCH transport system permease protein
LKIFKDKTRISEKKMVFLESMENIDVIEIIKLFLLEIQEAFFLLWKSLANIVAKPFYLDDLIEQLSLAGIGSLPVILLTGFFSGAVFALQTVTILKQYGETNTMGQLVAFTMIRELGPVLAALMFTGRVGAGFASELGGMVVSQQVDALRSLGTDYMKKLVTPRMLACVISLPLLTGIMDYVAIWSGYFLTWAEVHQSVHIYWQSIKQNLGLHDLYYSAIKAVAFAILIAVIACYQGLRTRGGTRGIGKSATRAVVISSILIIASDFFLTKGINILLHY